MRYQQTQVQQVQQPQQRGGGLLDIFGGLFDLISVLAPNPVTPMLGNMTKALNNPTPQNISGAISSIDSKEERREGEEPPTIFNKTSPQDQESQKNENQPGNVTSANNQPGSVQPQDINFKDDQGSQQMQGPGVNPFSMGMSFEDFARMNPQRANMIFPFY